MAGTTVEEAVTRNCQAMLTGNIAQIFADMTPEAMAKLATAGGNNAMAGGLPQLTSYDIISHTEEGDDHLYDVRFHGTPSFGVRARWREIAEQWKLVDFDGYALDGTEDRTPQTGTEAAETAATGDKEAGTG